MRVHSFLVLVYCLAVTSCNRYKLPPIKDAAALHKDSAFLYEKFPVSELPTNIPNYDYQHSLGIRIIPKDNWLPSILVLHPYMVCSYQEGIQMWIFWPRYKDEGKYWQGYYVVVNPAVPSPQTVTNHFVFGGTDKAGVLLVKQTPWEIPKLK